MNSCILAQISYEHRKSNEPWSIHILKVDPVEYSIVAERALGKALGREVVSSIATRTNAIAAINGGLFSIGGDFDGDPAGILKIGPSWISEPSLERAALGWADMGKNVLIDRLNMSFSGQFGKQTLTINGINRVRGAKETVLYTDMFGPSTQAAGGGREYVFGPGGFLELRETGDSPIPLGGIVLSLGSRLETQLDPVPPGTSFKLSYSFYGSQDSETNLRWREMDFIVGGTPVLLKNGRMNGDYSRESIKESFVNERHPRTAVGRTAEGLWVLVVVDGRNPRLSVGMTLGELADLMLELGCVDALNLDGGGSSTLFLHGQVLNVPANLMGERPVSDAILVIGK